MAALGQQVAVGTSATLIFEVIDEITYLSDGYTPTGEPNIFEGRNATVPLPILVSIPTGSTVYLGGSNVTSSSTNVGCPIVGPILIPYNAVGGDSLYGVVLTGTAEVGLLVLTQ